MEKGTFAAGCFWHVEETFASLPGVLSTRVGYIGGTTKNPNYQQVCSHETGHAEAVEVTFDPNKISYEKLLEAFWNLHNPTTPNRQGPDIGTQYRSVIFVHSDEQKKQAEASKKKLAQSGQYQQPIVTQILAATDFFPAEEYHQQYMAKKKSCR